jgi:hypothetical protein
LLEFLLGKHLIRIGKHHRHLSIMVLVLIGLQRSYLGKVVTEFSYLVDHFGQLFVNLSDPKILIILLFNRHFNFLSVFAEILLPVRMNLLWVFLVGFLHLLQVKCSS